MADELLQQFASFLQQWGLPSSLLNFIRGEIEQGAGQEQILDDLRATSEYKQAFPEEALRLQNGYSYLAEGQVLSARGEIRRLTQAYFGYNPDDNQIAQVIGNNKSPVEFEHDLKTLQSFERYGDTVKQLFFQELGYAPSDERIFAFMHSDIPTPELDRAYESALMRGEPANLGLGIRPEEEAQILRSFGIDPNKAFAGYQGIAGELPRTERLAAIEAEINRGIDGGTMPHDTAQVLGNTPFATLFRAIQLGDASALNTIRQQMAHEISRFQAGGGPITSGLKTPGLLTEQQRQGV